MADAGTATAAAVAALLELGVARVVIGTESLPGVEAFRRLRAELPDAPLVLSLDLRGGRLLSPDPELEGIGASDALARFAEAGAGEAIVLDLMRVGSGEGPGVSLLGELHAGFPDVAAARGRRRPPRRRPPRAGRRRSVRGAGRDRPARRRHRTRRAGQALSSRCSTSAAATSTPVSRSTPRQPGMPLTSIT